MRVNLFERKIERLSGDDPCWEWTGRIDRHGYGLFGDRLVHRVSYEHYVGPIPAGLTIDHLCRNTICVNPEHLEPVTQAENNRRGREFRRANGIFPTLATHCRKGHEYTPENTYRPPGTNDRRCRICQRAAVDRYNARKGSDR